MTAEGFAISGIPIGFYAVCWIGSLALYFQMRSTNKPVLKVLPHINPTWKDSPWAIFFDAILVTMVGAFIATISTEPINAQQAIAAGLGWTGLLSVVSA